MIRGPFYFLRCNWTVFSRWGMKRGLSGCMLLTVAGPTGHHRSTWGPREEVKRSFQMFSARHSLGLREEGQSVGFGAMSGRPVPSSWGGEGVWPKLESPAGPPCFLSHSHWTFRQTLEDPLAFFSTLVLVFTVSTPPALTISQHQYPVPASNLFIPGDLVTPWFRVFEWSRSFKVSQRALPCPVPSRLDAQANRASCHVPRSMLWPCRVPLGVPLTSLSLPRHLLLSLHLFPDKPSLTTPSPD